MSDCHVMETRCTLLNVEGLLHTRFPRTTNKPVFFILSQRVSKKVQKSVAIEISHMKILNCLSIFDFGRYFKSSPTSL